MNPFLSMRLSESPTELLPFFPHCLCVSAGRSESGATDGGDGLSGTVGWSPESPPPRDTTHTSS